MTDAETVTTFDLEAYVDGQLDPERRFEVEDYLARHPDAAARVMADMGARDALRLLAAAPLGPPPAAQLEAVARLRGGLLRAGRVRALGRIAAALALVMLGALAGRFAPLISQPEPSATEFVADAVQAHSTSLMRAAMRSQPEAAYYNPSEIRSATRIVLPQLPVSWQVTDVQVFPSDEGPTVAMAMRTRDLGPISLFAARTADFAEREPQTVQTGARAVAYWQIGHVAYALTGAAAPADLQRAAGRLSDALHEGPGASRTVLLSGPQPIRQ